MTELPTLLNGVGAVGIAVGYTGLLFWMLATGRLCTGRELREKNQRINAQAEALRTRDRQLSLVLTEAMATISPVLRAMRAAADAEESP